MLFRSGLSQLPPPWLVSLSQPPWSLTASQVSLSQPRPQGLSQYSGLSEAPQVSHSPQLSAPRGLSQSSGLSQAPQVSHNPLGSLSHSPLGLSQPLPQVSHSPQLSAPPGLLQSSGLSQPHPPQVSLSPFTCSGLKSISCCESPPGSLFPHVPLVSHGGGGHWLQWVFPVLSLE